MWANNVPIYQTQCLREYKTPNLEEILKKYNFKIFSTNINKKSHNKFNSYNHTISNRESVTIMNDDYSRIQLGKLYNNVTKEEILLNYPINFKIECDENGYYYINETFNLYVYGKTQEEAENKLVDAFKEQLNIFAYEEDNKLDKNAIALKKRLLEVYNNNA